MVGVKLKIFLIWKIIYKLKNSKGKIENNL
jgi:hypothetical protein